MKRLSIIVPTDSALDSWLSDAGFIYDKVVRSSNKTLYKINLTHKMDLINLRISQFRLKDFCICCKRGKFTFCVPS